MKKQKIKKFFNKNIYAFFVSFFVFGTVFGASTSYIISTQTATQEGSNNSFVSFTGTTGNQGYYVNDENNSTIINNYFRGYYYDNLFGFFKLDWSTDKSKNVRIIGSTTKCQSGYGYKLGGKAYSEVSGYIDFNYNSNTYVYYCISDGKLHGYAYGEQIGYQNFEGIDLDISVDIDSLVEKVSSDLFINDTTNIETSINGNNQEVNSVGGNILQSDILKESIFYIIK